MCEDLDNVGLYREAGDLSEVMTRMSRELSWHWIDDPEVQKRIPWNYYTAMQGHKSKVNNLVLLMQDLEDEIEQDPEYGKDPEIISQLALLHNELKKLGVEIEDEQGNYETLFSSPDYPDTSKTPRFPRGNPKELVYV